MTVRPAHFTRTDEDRYLPTRYAQSHWGAADHLNGPALVGLAARTLEASFGMADFMPARLTVDLFKVARGVPTVTKVGLVRDGRRVRNSECEIMQDGSTVARATMVQYRRAAAPLGQQWVSATDFAWPAEFGPSELSYMGSDGVGWTSGIAEHQNTARKRFINRMIDVVEGARQHAVRPGHDDRRGDQPGHQPRHRRGRIHQRGSHRGARAVACR